MSEERNAATYRRWFDEGCSQGNVDLADELYSPDYVTHARGRSLLRPSRDSSYSSARYARGCLICIARWKK
jgi:hypothetical protein